jgi:sulfotransferase
MNEDIKKMVIEELEKNRKTYYFMAGLPRSGSTLLSSLLNQNPRIHSGPSSPVTGLMLLLEQQLSSDELFLAYPKPQQAARIIASTLENYYSDVEKPVIIDKNRSWVNRVHYIPGYFNIEAKIICPVRNISDILTSFISMHRRNGFVSPTGKINFIDDMLVKSGLPLTDENRCQILVSQNGILGQSYFGIKDALVKGYQKNLHFVEYDDLMNNPKETMDKLYEFLGEDYYEHDFSKIENIHKERDAEVYGINDMHDVRSELKKTSADPAEILPESILKQCQGTEFWREAFEEYVEGNDEETDFTEIKNNDSGSEESKVIGS